MEIDEAELLKEQMYPSQNMTNSERDFYIELIHNCKDIKDPTNLDIVSPGKIVEMHLKKIKDDVYFNGSVAYSLKNGDEYRCINGEIFSEKNSLSVDMHIVRLKCKDSIKEYTTLDEFTLINNMLISRKSSYNFELPKTYKEKLEIKNGGIRK